MQFSIMLTAGVAYYRRSIPVRHGEIPTRDSSIVAGWRVE